MRKVVHPECCGCGSRNPDFESALFGLRVCYQCLYTAASWLMNRDLVNHNPLAQELFDGVFQGGPVPAADEYTVTHDSLYGSGSSYSVMKRLEIDV